MTPEEKEALLSELTERMRSEKEALNKELQDAKQQLLLQQVGTTSGSSSQVGNTNNFPKLNGTNYQSWREMVGIALKLRGLEKALSEANVDSGLNLQAKLVLLETMDESHRSQVRGCATAQEVLMRLELVYADNSASNLHRMLTGYYRYTKDPKDSMSEHVGKMDMMRNTLRDLKIPVEDERIHQATIIGSLPLEYSNMMEIWDLTHPEMRTTANLVSRLLKRETDLKLSATSDPALFLVRRGKQGARAVGPRERPSLAELKRSTSCHSCGEKGHWKDECPLNSNRANGQSNSVQHKNKLAFVDDSERAEFLEKIGQPWTSIVTLNVAVKNDAKTSRPAADSGASAHSWKDKDAFVNLRYFQTPIKCTIGDGNTLDVVGIGTVPIVSQVGKSETRGLLENVFYAPKLPMNLYSIGAAAEKGVETTFKGGTCQMKLNGAVIVEGKRGNDRLYMLNIRADKGNPKTLVSQGPKTMGYYHKVLGHAGSDRIKTFLRENGLPIPGDDGYDCADCPAGKAKHVPHPSIGARADAPGRIHLDLSGDENKYPSLEGYKNYLLAKDEYTGFCMIYFCKDKTAVPATIAKMLTDFEVISGQSVREVFSDNGSEFRNKVVELLFLKHEIRHLTSAPYCPQQNGRIEREMQTITYTARTILLASKLPKNLWPRAIETAVHLKNILPTKASDTSPYELITNRKPTVKHLRVFGEPVHVIVNDQYLTKWDARTTPGYLVGFTEKHNTYQVYLPDKKRVIKSCDVIFASHSMRLNQSPETKSANDDSVVVQTSVLTGNDQDELFRAYDTNQWPSGDYRGWASSTPLPQSIGEEEPEADRKKYVTGPRLTEFFENNRKENMNVTDWDIDDRDSVEEIPPPIPARRCDLPPRIPERLTGRHVDTPRPADRQASDNGRPTSPPILEDKTIGHERAELDTTAALTEDVTMIEPPRLSDSHDGPPELVQQNYLEQEEHEASFDRPRLLYTAMVDSLNSGPGTYAEAMSSPDAEQWDKAMERELEAHRKCSTWEVVEKPTDRKRLTSKWVFSFKRDKSGNVVSHKARMVARGFEQRDGLDCHETFAPVAKLESIRTVMAVVAAESLSVRQFDVCTAFLHGKLEETVYLDPPPGIRIATDQCLKLDKALYGLKQAPRAWNSTFNKALLEMGFLPTTSDQCVYTHKFSGLMLVIYVDDGLVLGATPEECDEVINNLELKFDIKRLTSQCFVGFEISSTPGRTTMSQKRYISDVLERFGMDMATGVSSPMVNTKDLFKTEDDKPTTAPYRQAIGCLQYLANASRPDVMFASNVLARFNAQPKEKHWTAVKRVLRYLKQTAHYELVYSGPCETITVFSDADWGSDEQNRASTSGLLIKLGSSPVIFASRKQSDIAQSTTEAEYIAANEATKELSWLLNLLNEINIVYKQPKLLVDNLSTIKQIVNADTKRRSKCNARWS